MYRYKLIAEPAEGNHGVLCVDCVTGEKIFVNDMYFSYLRANRDIDLSVAKCYRYGKDFQLSEEHELHYALSHNAPTVLYEMEYKGVFTYILCVGMLSSFIVNVKKCSSVSDDVWHLSSFKALLNYQDMFFKARYSSLATVKTFTDCVYIESDIELAAKRLSLSVTDSLSRKLREKHIGAVICKRGILSFSDLYSEANRYIRLPSSQLYKSNLCIPTSSKSASSDKNNKFTKMLVDLIEELKVLDELAVESAKTMTWSIKEVNKLKLGCFNVVVTDGTVDKTLTELELGGLVAKGDSITGVSSFSNNGVLVQYYSLSSNMKTSGLIVDDSMFNCIAFVNGFAPVLLSFIKMSGMTEEKYQFKIMSLLSGGILSKFQDYCGFKFRVFFEVKSDFEQWLEKHTDKYKTYKQEQRVSDKRFEGVSPLLFDKGVVRASVFRRWFNNRLSEYRDIVLMK